MHWDDYRSHVDCIGSHATVRIKCLFVSACYGTETWESNVQVKAEIHPKTPNKINSMHTGLGLHTKYMHVAIQASDMIRVQKRIFDDRAA